MTTQPMHGKHVLVTGGSSGIGYETALALAKQGATVVITGRSEARALEAVNTIRQQADNSDVHMLLADMTLQQDIHTLADDFMASFGQLDVLVNNVGGIYRERWETPDGVEAHFAVNVIAPFLLTQRLRPALAQADSARVINVTGGMPTLKFDSANLQAKKNYLALVTYSHAKTAMMAMSYTLAEQFEADGISVNVAYPGGASTNMSQTMTPDMVPLPIRLMWPVFKVMTRSGKAVRAAQSSIYLASSLDVQGMSKAYFNTHSKRVTWPKAVLDADNRAAVWKLCDALTSDAIHSNQILETTTGTSTAVLMASASP